MFLNASEKIKFAEKNFNLIHYVANSFDNTHLSHDELVSIGSVGYTKALNTYRKDKETKFSTYAIYCIKNEILHFLRKEKKHKNNLLSGNVLSEDKEGNILSLEDIFSNDMNDEAFVDDLVLLKEDIKILTEAIKKLSERDQYIIKNRYGLDGRKIMTQYDIATELGMSQANVSKLEQGILKKLFRKLNGRIEIEDNNFYRDYDSKTSKEKENQENQENQEKK